MVHWGLGLFLPEVAKIVGTLKKHYKQLLNFYENIGLKNTPQGW